MLNLDVRNKFPPAFPPETNVIYIYMFFNLLNIIKE